LHIFSLIVKHNRLFKMGRPEEAGYGFNQQQGDAPPYSPSTTAQL
jgi:hypothetical protein